MMIIPSIPQIYRHVNRWREIVSVLSKYGLADWISRFDLDFAKGLIKNRDGEKLARQSRESRIRMALVELGPTFIKLGQIASTRPDLVGIDLADELKRLQADVPADPPEVVRLLVENELGRSIDQVFAEFDETPLASASIGQVHLARLASGERVVVKVQHEGIEEKMRVDLDLLAALAQLAQKIPELAVYRPRSTVAEFRRVLRHELDFERELRNLEHFQRDFRSDPTVHIPGSFAEFSTSRMLTMELIEGIKLEERERLVAAGTDLEEVARRGARLYLEMIFANGFFHADPHPGNVIVLEGNVIGLLDFGMVVRLDESLREQIEDMLMAIVERDAYLLTAVIMRLGAAPADLDEAALRIDVTDFVEHYANAPLYAFDLSGALREIIEIVRRYRIILPAPISMLLKVLIMLEGTSRLLSPRFCLMDVILPYRKQMVRRWLSPQRQARKMRRLFYEAEQLFEVLPRRIMDIMQQIQSGRFDVHLDHRGLEPSVNRLVLGMLASALFLGSSILLSRNVGPLLYDTSVLGVAGCSFALLLGLRLLRAISKSGHLDRRR